MSREIKFRVWDGNRISYADSSHGRVLCDNGGHSYLPFYTEKNIPHLTRVEVQQFIGLKDKNGKEIYEGDIINFQNFISAPVIYSASTVGYVLDTSDRSIFDKKHGDYIPIFFALSKEYEVIGNIFENPELLK